jgi:hypothetical protein
MNRCSGRYIFTGISCGEKHMLLITSMILLVAKKYINKYNHTTPNFPLKKREKYRCIYL